MFLPKPDMCFEEFSHSDKPRDYHCWFLFSDEVTSAMATGMVVSTVDSFQKMLTCTVCRLVCTGDVPMRQHLQSDAHMRKIKK